MCLVHKRDKYLGSIEIKYSGEEIHALYTIYCNVLGANYVYYAYMSTICKLVLWANIFLINTERIL